MEIIPTPSSQAFDRELSIVELLNNSIPKALETIFSQLFEQGAQIVNLKGEVIVGALEGSQGVQRTEILMQLEPVAYLESASSPIAQAVAQMIELILQSSERYLMTSALHLEAVHADYERLKQKHEELKQSEQRYRELANSLEEQVKEQVAEIEKGQAQLLQSQKLASVGQLAGGVAHEINNPLGFIQSNLDTAKNYVEELSGFVNRVITEPSEVALQLFQEQEIDFLLDDFGGLLRESSVGVGRVAKIVADLRDFSEITPGEMVPLKLNDLIMQALEVVHAEIGEQIIIAPELGEIPLVHGQASHISQVLTNLLLNSIKAIGEKPGLIKISSEECNNDIVVSIKDSGCGISEEHISQVFDPFFTTREIGEGRRLGLSVAHDVMTALGGTIELKSKIDEGSTFTLHFPRMTNS